MFRDNWAFSHFVLQNSIHVMHLCPGRGETPDLAASVVSNMLKLTGAKCLIPKVELTSVWDQGASDP